MYTKKQIALIAAAKLECRHTQKSIELTLEIPFVYQGRTQVEKRKFTYEFDARGIPCPKVHLHENGEVTVRMYRADPGIYLASLDSIFPRNTNKPKEQKRTWKTKQEHTDKKSFERKSRN